MSTPSVAAPAGTRVLTMAQAVNEALAEELRRDETVFVIGEDVAEAGTPFKVLAGLVDEFGTERIVDSPISEPGITGLGVGAAMTGMRPVVDIMFGDFLTLVMDQLANQAAKAHYMSGGKLKVPLTLRTTMGATRRSAAQHSQSLQAWVAHVPGLKVVLPATPAASARRPSAPPRGRRRATRRRRARAARAPPAPAPGPAPPPPPPPRAAPRGGVAGKKKGGGTTAPAWSRAQRRRQDTRRSQ